ncbi:MAG: hypothetical protein JWQ04_2449 [Pedosphaera sp.]|nr:hypothetical protein [Pedosphaera sp.]
MPETFVPFVTATAKIRGPVFAPITSKTPSPAPESLAGIPTTPPSTPEACTKPTVTLERNGDIVSAIKIRCGCGEVVELTCVY